MKPLNIHYLATFDSGNAAVTWPQKDAESANIDQQQWNREISATLKINLLWRPFVALRHFELFDNLALAKFLASSERKDPRGLYTLAETQLIRVCSPTAASFEGILLDWAIGKRQQAPMHWHHLDADGQQYYDNNHIEGRLKDIQSLETVLRLENHRLSLSGMIQLYDRLFPKDQILVLSRDPHLPPDWYASRVVTKWENYLEARSPFRKKTKFTDQIEAAIYDCADRGVRRREFFTRVEQLKRQERKDRTNERRFDELSEAKCFVLNDAFFDEFEQFGHYQCGTTQGEARILASRRFAKPLFDNDPSTLPLDNARRVDQEAAVIRAAFVPLEALEFSDIAEWHTGNYTEARAFQESVRRIEVLFSRRKAPAIYYRDLQNILQEHLDILRHCVRRTLQRRGQLDMMEASWAELYIGVDPDAAAIPLALGIAALAYHVTKHIALADHVLTLFNHLFSFVLRKPRVVKYEWNQLEAIIKDDMLTSIDEQHS